ncbi:hypothetical protein PENTCL1PPCAC_29138, partial [Pristionchus entomophagus]
LLCAVSTLVMSTCPPQLERFHELDEDCKPEGWPYELTHIRDAADTSCGKSNFTTAFWEGKLSQEIMTLLAIDAVSKETRVSGPTQMILLKPLVDTLFAKFKSLENEEAKNYIDATGQSRLEITHKLPLNARIALMKAMKSAFGFEESPEMNRNRIDVAMKALERIESGTSNTTAISELFEKIHSLTNGTWFVPHSDYDEIGCHSFSEWMTKNENYTGIGPMEVLPAVEVLYLQYNTLSNTEAKEFVGKFISSWKEHYDQGDSKSSDGEEKVSFGSLSDEARSALTSTFPELFNNLEKNGKIEKKGA